MEDSSIPTIHIVGMVESLINDTWTITPVTPFLRTVGMESWHASIDDHRMSMSFDLEQRVRERLERARDHGVVSERVDRTDAPLRLSLQPPVFDQRFDTASLEDASLYVTGLALFAQDYDGGARASGMAI